MPRPLRNTGPLRQITGVEPISNGHTTAYLELLDCGHTGHARREAATVHQAIVAGARRRCRRCGRAASGRTGTTSPWGS